MTGVAQAAAGVAQHLCVSTFDPFLDPISLRKKQLLNAAVMPYRPGEAPAGSTKRPAFDLRAWTDRFEQRPYRVPRQPLTSITGHLGSQVSPLELSCVIPAHDCL